MKRKIILCFCSITMLIGTESSLAQKYVLWFSDPGTKWEEAIPIGNGRLGAMIRGGIHRDTLSLNEETLWAGEPKDKQNYEAHKYLPEIRSLLNERKTTAAEKLISEHLQSPWCQCYQPVGDLLLDFDHPQEISVYRRELNMDNGLLNITYQTGNVTFTREIFASYPDNVLVTHIFASRNAALTLVSQNPDKKIVLVSKDINLRLKAKSLNLNSDDYLTGKVKDTEKLFTGKLTVNVDDSLIDKIYQYGNCTPDEIELKDRKNNKYLIVKGDRSSVLCYFNSATQVVERIEKQTCYRITPRNSEQVFALHALLNPDVKLVSLQGVAGTGKTLLALAGALQQKRNFKQIYLARPIVPLSNRDSGFLPGTIEAKLSPYMEPLWDNLKFIKNQFNERDKEYKFIEDCVKEEKLVITPLAYIRGRSISNVFFIVDEAQNLTPHEVKTIITRAGEGTKIIFTGDIHQIDTPYLDAQSNGLSHLIDKVKNQPIYSHVALEKGERSELANIANELL